MTKECLWIRDLDPVFKKIYTSFFESQFDLFFIDPVEDLQKVLKSRPLPNFMITEMLASEDKHVSVSNSFTFKLIPTVVVSSLDDYEIIKGAFEAGVLDFLSKSIGTQLLNFKLSTAMKLWEVKTHSPIKYFTKRLQNLTLKERLILEALVERPNYAATREQIVQSVWSEMRVCSKALDVHLHHLRRKLRSIEYSIVLNVDGMYCLGKSNPVSKLNAGAL